MKSVRAPLFTDVGMMKNAFMVSTWRRSRSGILNMSLAIFCSALIRCSGAPVISADPLLNQRGQQMVGRQVVVTQAIEGGTGRVRCGDTDWLAQGPDAAAGARLTVTGSTGSTLIVDAVP